MQNKVEKEQVIKMVNSLTFQFARIGTTTTTVCEAFLPNGFSVGSGKSACVDPANYNYEDGCKYAKENALTAAQNKIWELEGYLLKVTGRTSDRFIDVATPQFLPYIFANGADKVKAAPMTRLEYHEYRGSQIIETSTESGGDCGYLIQRIPKLTDPYHPDRDSKPMNEPDFWLRAEFFDGVYKQH